MAKKQIREILKPGQEPLASYIPKKPSPRINSDMSFDPEPMPVAKAPVSRMSYDGPEKVRKMDASEFDWRWKGTGDNPVDPGEGLKGPRTPEITVKDIYGGPQRPKAGTADRYGIDAMDDSDLPTPNRKKR